MNTVEVNMKLRNWPMVSMVPFQIINGGVTAYIITLGQDVSLYYSDGQLIAARIGTERYKEKRNILPLKAFAHFNMFHIGNWPEFDYNKHPIRNLESWVKSKLNIEIKEETK
jgi:hypothetical protein